jgi:DNA-binding MarR family transcriptional regulator
MYSLAMSAHRSPESCVCLNLRAATRSVTQRYDQALAPSGLLSTQYSMLNAIENHGVMGVAELANWMSMDVSTATKNLRPLLTRGLVSLKSSAVDGRRREIRVTEKGKRALNAALPFWNQEQDKALKLLGPRKFSQLLSLLSELRPASN